MPEIQGKKRALTGLPSRFQVSLPKVGKVPLLMRDTMVLRKRKAALRDDDRDDVDDGRDGGRGRRCHEKRQTGERSSPKLTG